ncbi:MAG: Co2+/Mg2+ efflux protein ApaG [Chitinophagales bacterium]|nr:Co2+/Mg2+ efflux protein ApaG [Chitinophagales bacterium]
MKTLITQGIEVNVETFYQPAHSHPHNGKFVFAYHISISNHNLFTVQLLRRKWLVTDAYTDKRIVEGEGVVGRQPILYPGDSYQYVSGCNLATPIGKMEGVYYFENKITREIFEVNVPVFKMEAPEILN